MATCEFEFAGLRRRQRGHGSDGGPSQRHVAGGGAAFRINGGDASPTNFGAGATIDSTHANRSTSDAETVFYFIGTGSFSPNFGPNSFIGFNAEDDTNPGNFRYGYIEVLWNWTGNASTSTFQLLSAAYETQWNTGIVAGASATTGGGGAVPEPGEWAAMGILGAGLTGLVIRKRRRA